MNKSNNIVIILAAGKGTRMKSDLPKVLHTINNKPMICNVIETAKKITPKKIIVIVGYKKDMLIEAVNDDAITYVIQKEQKGTGHAIMQCIPEIKDFDGNILILSGDVPLIKSNTLDSFIQFHYENDSKASLISTELPNPSGYGRIIKNKNKQLQGIIEHKDASYKERLINEINSGIYMFNAKTLIDKLALLTNENIQSEYYLTQVFDFIPDNNSFVKKIKNFNEILGVNTLEELQTLDKDLYEKT